MPTKMTTTYKIGITDANDASVPVRLAAVIDAVSTGSKAKPTTAPTKPSISPLSIFFPPKIHKNIKKKNIFQIKKNGRFFFHYFLNTLLH